MNVYDPDTGKITSAYGGAGGGGGGGGGGFGVGGALSLAGKGIGAVSSIMAGRDQARALEAQAKAKRGEAREVKKQSVWEQIRMNEEMRRLRSTQRMLFGQAGVTLEGAPENLMRRSRSEFVQERLMGTRNMALEVQNLRADADQLDAAAKSAKRQGVMGAFSSFF